VDIVAVAVGGDEGVSAVSCWSNGLTLRWFYARILRKRQPCQDQPDSAHNIFHRAKADARIQDLHKPLPIPQQNGELDRVPPFFRGLACIGPEKILALLVFPGTSTQ
jgi:hypothetical protein